ncbi:hypothetical protein FJQ98_12325 [Lysinibacillus agricola]|uniref:DUF1430 domain-containing protein n=1 Tax=Lysinibacillus agricola TaxID=2590012 RepID=A0ABX7AXK7_9BACI|nr:MULTISPECIES: hypothetical protein [Lysinibacillus]KOS64426.1 hypothetical protein AN161_02385 [Lysinibacillus sp. FJAT-14222]QQP14713.1 hypothetical protein FJQ98_12325 [Lysinibacillus agricola]
MKKSGLSLILFFLVAMMSYPMTTIAKNLENDSLKVDICIIGGDNYFVYKIPKHLHNNTPYYEMKNNIESSLASHWKVGDAHYEAQQSDVAYTFFIKDLIHDKQNGQMKIAIPYNILVGMFAENEAIQLRILTSKLTDWKVNAKDWATLGFVEPLTYFSDQEYVYEGAVNELLQQRVGHFNGTVIKGQIVLHSVIYFNFIIVQLIACIFLSKRLKNRIIEDPENMHQFRKLNYMYQIIPIMIIVMQIVFLVMSGLLTAFSIYFNPGVDLLVIVGPILFNIVLLPMFFATIESEISKELENNSFDSDM